MSMPNIPDIDPDINITSEQALNLILTSIAMEEMSLSTLMDAESEKIRYVLKTTAVPAIFSPSTTA